MEKVPVRVHPSRFKLRNIMLSKLTTLIIFHSEHYNIERRHAQYVKRQSYIQNWLACDPEYCLPCSCQSCGQATRNICQYTAWLEFAENVTIMPVAICQWHVVWKWLGQISKDIQHLPSDQTIQIWMSSGKLCCEMDQQESEPTCERRCPRVTCVSLLTASTHTQ